MALSSGLAALPTHQLLPLWRGTLPVQSLLPSPQVDHTCFCGDVCHAGCMCRVSSSVMLAFGQIPLEGKGDGVEGQTSCVNAKAMQFAGLLTAEGCRGQGGGGEEGPYHEGAPSQVPADRAAAHHLWQGQPHVPRTSNVRLPQIDFDCSVMACCEADCWLFVSA